MHVLPIAEVAPVLFGRSPVSAPRRRYAAMLAALVAVGLALTLPYSLWFAATRPHYQPASTGLLVCGLLLQTAVFYVVIMLGLTVGPAVGLGWPPLRGWQEGTSAVRRGAAALAMAALMATGLALLLATLIQLRVVTSSMRLPALPGVLTTGMASVGAGIHEEVMFRLGVMTVVAWLFARLRTKEANSAPIVWGANVVAALLFGAAHLPIVNTVDHSLSDVAFVLSANGAVGIMCGWLYWRRGLMAAMTAHATFDLVLKVLLPALPFFR